MESTKTQPHDAAKYIIEKDQPRRVDVRPSKRYHFDEIVGNALQVVEEVDASSTYMEAFSNFEFKKWHVVMRSKYRI